jgi:hypothetical protein
LLLVGAVEPLDTATEPLVAEVAQVVIELPQPIFLVML